MTCFRKFDAQESTGAPSFSRDQPQELKREATLRTLPTTSEIRSTLHEPTKLTPRPLGLFQSATSLQLRATGGCSRSSWVLGLTMCTPSTCLVTFPLITSVDPGSAFPTRRNGTQVTSSALVALSTVRHGTHQCASSCAPHHGSDGDCAIWGLLRPRPHAPKPGQTGHSLTGLSSTDSPVPSIPSRGAKPHRSSPPRYDYANSFVVPGNPRWDRAPTPRRVFNLPSHAWACPVLPSRVAKSEFTIEVNRSALAVPCSHSVEVL